MLQIKSFLIAALCEIVCKAFDFEVGQCRQDILDQRYQAFHMITIANTGWFQYNYISGNPKLRYGSTNIYGDEVVGYKELIRITDIDFRGYKLTCYLNELDRGVLNETCVSKDANGQTVVRNYILIVINYDPPDGVLYYVRCSEHGRYTTDCRVILWRSSISIHMNAVARRYSTQWCIADRKKGFIGEPLRQLQFKI